MLAAASTPVGARSQDGFLVALGTERPRAAALYDVAEERFLGSYRGRSPLPVASLLKMVTALVVSDHLPPDTTITMSRLAANITADRVVWQQGARFSVDELLHGMLLESSNGAAYALAIRAGGGSMQTFLGLAREKLAALGATGTVLLDPSGLDAAGQHSTARDMALVAAAVLADPWLASIVTLDSYRLPWPVSGSATFNNLNRYLGRDASAIGVKNGYTSDAGNTVAAAAERNGRIHIAVVLAGPDPYGQAERLIDLAFTLAPGTEPEPELRAPRPEATSARLVAPPQPVAVAATEPAPVPMPDSPTFLRFLVASAFGGTVVRITHVRRRRARRGLDPQRR